MHEGFSIREIGQSALASTNELFIEARHGVRVAELTADDLAWCVALTRNLPEDRKLPWDQCGGVLAELDTFNFSFKLLDKDYQPAGACLCRYCPATADLGAVLNIEMIQNFNIMPSILDGNTMQFALWAVIYFMLDTECEGVRLMSPINDDIADYYIREHGFWDISGDRSILYRDADGLVTWFQAQLGGPQVAGE
ncbi:MULTISPECIES: hypothetical protein [Dickeya]|uniref:N-acetyltransferase n=1 Tax=Dickeya lacustris TaxID=2259638 RepID=A0ABY8G5A0_9GAMM|nr:hypothetical protein [Dickeya lacustris]WFN55126.1 hypothetical protein O1Q98_16060 [Dickeya lacustris]